MRQAFRILGWVLLTVGVLLLLIGITTLPGGGLMFALPYFFLIPGVASTAFAGLLLCLTSERRKENSRDQKRGPEVQ